MTDSLREEIEQYLGPTRIDNHVTATDEILKIFEKRIDREINRLYRIGRSSGGYPRTEKINTLKEIKKLLK